ncbi:annexin B11-like [Sitophilus oryzae]|uniref:Annexin n=1 Tax=Sitophilus oryzae TaxID=7048 RepID=A0A6J2XMW6_SITOR|nr:annexin B11-like [Sitophilus oryzae]
MSVTSQTPTVVPVPFDPQADAKILNEAMRGFGTDEKSIIHVLAHRPNAQRLEIASQFRTLYGRDLVNDLKSETSGDFSILLVAMMTPLPEYYAKELHDAIMSWKQIQVLGRGKNVLIEVLCTKSNQEIMVIRQAYEALYFKTLEEDLRGDSSGTFRRLMVSLCNAGRDEIMVVDENSARTDARELLQAGELRLGTDERTFIMILCQRNLAQLQLIFQEYYNSTGHDIEEAIKNEFSGNSKDGLLAVVRSIKNQSAFFAKLHKKSMKGLGTNDSGLIRLVVTRSEIDMVEIKAAYQSCYGESLADAIKGDCSGDYMKCLLHLIGEA